MATSDTYAKTSAEFKTSAESETHIDPNADIDASADLDAAIPVACSLTSAGLAVQAQRWFRLAARALSQRATTPDGLRLTFRTGPDVEAELRELAAIENECCSWARWIVTATEERVIVDVRSAGDGVAALHGMFAGAPGDVP